MVNTPERNPGGAVGLFDGGTPRTITYKARSNISGGYWVAGSSSLAGVGSLASTFVAADIEGMLTGSIANENVIGFNLQDTASGTYGTAAQRGVFIMPVASGTSMPHITAGRLIAAGSAGTVVLVGSTASAGGQDTDAGAIWNAGRALTTGSGNNANNVNDFILVSVNV